MAREITAWVLTEVKAPCTISRIKAMACLLKLLMIMLRLLQPEASANRLCTVVTVRLVEAWVNMVVLDLRNLLIRNNHLAPVVDLAVCTILSVVVLRTRAKTSTMASKAASREQAMI